jgi:Dolichyl-phosphate-mannose-protein mannosyltransferase
MAAIVALFGLHAVHLRADFPNFSPWMDYAKYTDEGWYSNAAIEAFLRGSWYVPGDFNTAVALPVWPFLEWIVFHFTGVSVVAARGLAVAVFGADLWLTYALVRARRGSTFGVDTSAEFAPGLPRDEGSRRWPALLAATLVASSGFLYCFSRLAILEPLVVFFMLLSWLLLLRAPPGGPGRLAKGYPRLVAVGVVLCLMVLTKTTAVVLLPSTFYLLWKTHRRPVRACGIVALATAVPWLTYYFLLVRPRYLADYKYLFSANVYQQPVTFRGWVIAFWYSVHGGLWIGRTFFFACVFLLLASLAPFARMRSLWRNPLFVAAALSIACQIFFIGYHNNMQPRYYVIVAYPLFILIAIGVASLLLRPLHDRTGGTPGRLVLPFPFIRQGKTPGWLVLPFSFILRGGSLAVVVFGCAVGIWQTIEYVRHPQYTFVNAAESLTQYIDEHPNGNRLLLSISGNQIGLVTGIPSICDDFGTLTLPLRIHQYQPGWYAAWNELDPGSLEDIHTQFRVEQVAKFPAFDDPDRNVLILYKLHPLPLAQQTLVDDGDADENADAQPDSGSSEPR